VRNEVLQHRVKEERNIVHTIKRRKANWIGHILRRNCLMKHVIEGELERRIEMTGRRGRRSDQILDDLKETRGYWKLKEEALDRTTWRTRFGRGFGFVVRLRDYDDDDDDEEEGVIVQYHINADTRTLFSIMSYVNCLQAVSLRSATAEARLQSQCVPCGICGGGRGKGIDFSPNTSVSLVSIFSTDAPSSQFFHLQPTPYNLINSVFV
jgi:hypothetical protein